MIFKTTTSFLCLVIGYLVLMPNLCAQSVNLDSLDNKPSDKISDTLEQYEKTLIALSDDSSRWAQIERARVLVKKGTVYHQFDDYPTAYSLYLEAEDLFLNNREYNDLVNIYSKMGNIFVRNSDYVRNAQILKKADAIIDKVTDAGALASYYTDRACLYGHDEDYDNADLYFEKALALLQKNPDQHRLGTLYFNMAYFLKEKERLQEAETCYRLSLTAFEKTGEKFDICDGIIALGRILHYQGKNDDAEKQLQKALLMAHEINSNLLIRNCYDVFAFMEYDRKNFQKAFDYLSLDFDYHFLLTSEETQKQLSFMASKYELSQKELNIRELEQKTAIQKAQMQLQKVWLLVAFILVAILIIFSIGYIRYSIQKRQLTQARIRQLEQEKQLVATQAVLDGETAERTRLARDLHDGLGGMLSVVKLNLNDVKKGATLEGEDVARFDQALGVLEESIRELRRVAHNMMPDSLTRYGLKVSLTDFCNNIPNAEFHFFGSEERLEANLETMVYRTIHELVNNALKHAKANRIIVQLIHETDRLAFTVQDDGCGFDASARTDGTGLKNIRNRIRSYNGCIDIWSKPDAGTEVNIEFNLEN